MQEYGEAPQVEVEAASPVDERAAPIMPGEKLIKDFGEMGTFVGEIEEVVSIAAFAQEVSLNPVIHLFSLRKPMQMAFSGMCILSCTKMAIKRRSAMTNAANARRSTLRRWRKKLHFELRIDNRQQLSSNRISH